MRCRVTNPDIHFGELEETGPGPRVRPDRDQHFAVIAVGTPSEMDVPVFADLDVVRELEAHALSDPAVELGGVLLGGQHHDALGEPFVLVADSLRAQHFENSRGSFKFTHDTWQEISRQRDEFSPDLQIVGWYHTHPDWGVFLSSMDLFICEHFFSRPLDVALVIDPCRQERAFFQWRAGTPCRVQQAGGFYLVSSRFRQEELAAYAAFLEGKYTVSTDPRLRSFPQASPVPVVIRDGSHAWQWSAVLGSLTIQLALLGLIMWRLFPATGTEASRDTDQRLALLERTFGTQAAALSQDAEINAKLEVLDAVVGRVPGEQQGLVTSLAERTSEVQELKASLRGHRALESELDRRLTALQSELQKAQERSTQLGAEVERLQTSLARARQLNESHVSRLAELEGTDQGSAAAGTIAGTSDPDRRLWNWSGMILGGLAGFLAIGVIVTALLHWQQARRLTAGTSEESSEPANRD